ncbi:MAG: hypothetical protein GYB33_09665 [Gammaproteobacteria bacterium]|nr:hypothetical protein [Gammaproteobacteria bacterium]
MAEISVEEDLATLLVQIQEAMSQVSEFRSAISDVQEHAQDRLSGFIEKIEAEQEQLADRFTASSESVGAAHDAVSMLIEQAQARVADIVGGGIRNAEIIRNLTQSSEEHAGRMESAHNDYTSLILSLIGIAEQSRQTATSKIAGVRSDVETQINGPATTTMTDTKASLDNQQSSTNDRLLDLRDRDYNQFKEGLSGTREETINLSDNVRSLIEQSKNEKEAEQRSGLANGRDELNASLSDTSSRLSDLGQDVRRISTTVGEGIDTVSGLAQTSAVGLTTAIGALNSTYELLEEIKSAW